MPDLNRLVVLDDGGGVFETNLQFARMLGYSMEEMSALHVWDWESIPAREEAVARGLATDEKGDHFESRHRRKDGSLYDVEISGSGAFYAGKKYIFCVCRDISERKRSEREREALINDLQAALAEARALKGILPLLLLQEDKSRRRPLGAGGCVSASAFRRQHQPRHLPGMHEGALPRTAWREGTMTHIAIAADHAGYGLRRVLKTHLDRERHSSETGLRPESE